MKKRLLPVALLFGTFAANAQVGIGTATPNKSAELLIESSNRGLLIPNVALTSTTDKTTITNGNVQSLMVYATKTQDDITPGYYYWDINKWVRLAADKDIPQIVVNNFQEIVNKDGDKVQNIIKNIVKNTEGNVIYEGDKLYQITKEGDKIVKQEIKDKLTSISYDEATGDYIYYNENAVDRNGKIIGEGIRIKVKETVINKFGDIINNKTVQEHITNYLDGTSVGGNVYYEGDKLTYVTKEGDRKEVSINQVVTANESKTAIITVNKKQYYVSEEYLVANKGVVPTTVDAKNLPKGIYAIDVVGGVVNNFEEIVQQGPVTVDGRTFKTVNDYITYLTESKGGFTKIVYDQKTGDVIFQQWNETTQKFENVDNSKFSTIVKGNETVTTLINNNDGTYTYTSENGTKTIVDIPSSVVKQFETIVKQPVTVDGRIFNNVDEYIKYVTESKGGFTKIVYNKEGDVVFQEWNETTQKFENVDNSKFSTIVKENETVTTLVDHGNGTLSYTDEKGKTVSFDSNKTKVEVKDGVYTFKDGDNKLITSIDTNAKALGYDNSKSGIDAKNVQDALDKLADNLLKGAGVKLEDKNDGKVTLVADNGTVLGSIDKSKLIEDKANKGLFTFTRNDGTDVVFDINKVNVSESKDAAGNVLGYEFKDSKGVVITTVKTAATNNYYDNSKSGIDAKNVQDALDKITNTIATTKGDLSVAGGLEFTGATNGTAKLLADAGIQIADGGVITSKIDDKAVTSDKLNGGQGAEGRVGVAGADGKITYQTLDSVVKANETVTVLVKNDNGTYTYYNEKQIDTEGKPKADEKGVTIDPKEVSVALNTTTNKYEFKNSNGDVVGEIDSNANSIVFNNNNTAFNSTNVQDALVELLNKITTVEVTNGDLALAGGLEFTGTTNGTAKLLADAGIQIANKGIKTEKLDDKAVTNEKLADKSVSADKMTSFTTDNGTKTPVGEGQIPVADGKGGVTYKEISGETLKGKTLTSGSISVIGGDKALLDATKIEITGGKNKGEVLVTTDKPMTNDKGEVVKDAVGNIVYVTEWQNPKDFVSDTVTASNGITVTNNAKDGSSEFKLGGYLTQPTVIDTKENTLAIANLKEVAKGEVKNNNVVMADANGVLQETSAANLIGEVITDGNISAKGLKGVGITVTAGDKEGTDTLVASSLLKDVTLGIANGAVTSDKMKATVIDANGGSKNAEAGMVPVANADGTVTYNKLDSKDVTYTKPAGDDNGLTSNTVEGVINELAGKKGDLKVNGGMLKVDDNAKGALRHDATISLDLAGVNKIVETKVDYTAKVEDVIILADALSGDVVVSLPDAKTNKGKKYTIKKHDAKEDYYVTVKGNIIGATELYTALPYSGWDFVSDGTQWQIVNKF